MLHGIHGRVSCPLGPRDVCANSLPESAQLLRWLSCEAWRTNSNCMFRRWRTESLPETPTYYEYITFVYIRHESIPRICNFFAIDICRPENTFRHISKAFAIRDLWSNFRRVCHSEFARVHTNPIQSESERTVAPKLHSSFVFALPKNGHAKKQPTIS